MDGGTVEKKDVPITRGQYLNLIQKNVENELSGNVQALPKGFNSQRFVLNTMSLLRDNLDDYKGIEATSVAMALVKGAYLGLDFFNGECYAIPYGGKANFQTDYKGEIKLAKKYSRNPIKDIYAKNVREGDFFEEIIEDGNQRINFKPKPFSNNKIIGTFAVCLFKDGSMIYDTMSLEEIENTRQTYSKAQNSKAWRNSPGEMYKKTVIRRLCKLIDLEFDNLEQQRAFVEGSDFTLDNQERPEVEQADVLSPFGKPATNLAEQPMEDVIDVEGQFVIDGLDIEEA